MFRPWNVFFGSAAVAALLLTGSGAAMASTPTEVSIVTETPVADSPELTAAKASLAIAIKNADSLNAWHANESLRAAAQNRTAIHEAQVALTDAQNAATAAVTAARAKVVAVARAGTLSVQAATNKQSAALSADSRARAAAEATYGTIRDGYRAQVKTAQAALKAAKLAGQPTYELNSKLQDAFALLNATETKITAASKVTKAAYIAAVAERAAALAAATKANQAAEFALADAIDAGGRSVGVALDNLDATRAAATASAATWEQRTAWAAERGAQEVAEAQYKVDQLS